MNRQQALETLGLTAAATPEEIRQAYDRQIGQLDGIASMNPAPALLETVRQTRVKLEAAWAVLGGTPAPTVPAEKVTEPITTPTSLPPPAAPKRPRKPVPKGLVLAIAGIVLVAVSIYLEVPKALRDGWNEWQLARRQEKFEAVWTAEIKPAADTYSAKINALLPELVGYQTLRQIARDHLAEEKEPVAQTWHREQVRLSEDYYQRLIDPLFHGRDLVEKSNNLHQQPGGNYEAAAQALREYVAELGKITVPTEKELSAAWVKDYMLPLAHFSWPNREHFELLWRNSQSSLIAGLEEAIQRTETANPASPVTSALLLDLGHLTEVRETELKPRLPDIDAVVAKAQSRWPQVFTAMEWDRFPDVATVALTTEARAAEQAKDWPRCVAALRALEWARPRTVSPELQLLPAFDAYIAARLQDLGRPDDAYLYQRRLAEKSLEALAWIADYDFKIGRYDRAFINYERILDLQTPESVSEEVARRIYSLYTDKTFLMTGPPVARSLYRGTERSVLYQKAEELLLELAKRDDSLGRWAKNEYADVHSDRIFKPEELSARPKLVSPLGVEFPTDPEITVDALRLRVEFVVNANGRVSDFSVIGDAPHPAFLAELRAGLPMLKFTPGKFRDRPVKTTFRGQVEFTRPPPPPPTARQLAEAEAVRRATRQRNEVIQEGGARTSVESSARAVASGPATVFIYRPSKIIGMIQKIKVDENGRQLVALPNKSYVRLTLPAGRHTLKSSFTFSKDSLATFDFEPGRTYYLQTGIVMGTWSSTSPLTLTDEATARAAMSEMKQVSDEKN